MSSNVPDGSNLALSSRSYHINIGVGDCAIHLLVDDNHKVGPKPGKSVIYRAVLIDGGKSGPGPLAAIKDVISTIESEFAFSQDYLQRYKYDPVSIDKKPKLRFDSIVITHWDGDHYGGIREFLVDTLRRDLLAAIDVSTIQKSRDSLPPQIIGLPCSRFKYDTLDLGSQFKYKDRAIANNIIDCNLKIQGVKNELMRKDFEDAAIQNLRTTFYCAYVGTVTRFNIGTQSTSFQNKPFFLSNNGNREKGAEYEAKSKEGNTLSIQLKFVDSSKGSDPYQLVHVSSLRAHFDDYLGWEIFFNTQPPKPHAALDKPKLLIGALKKNQGPRLYIVAGNQKIVGNQALGSPAEVISVTGKNAIEKNVVTKWRPTRKVIDTRDGSLGTTKFVERSWGRKGSKQKNSPSIVTLLMASTGIVSPKTGSGWKLIHYSAGDALWDVETGVTNWLTGLGKNKVNLDRVPFLKLSHHGASDSTPTTLLAATIPQYIISPSGKDTGFGHPRPEILTYIQAFNNWIAKDLSSPKAPIEICLYNWPIWLCNTDPDVKMRFSLRMMDDLKLDDSVANFQSSLKNLDNDKNSILSVWQKVPIKGTVDNRSKAFADIFYERWMRISRQTKESMKEPLKFIVAQAKAGLDGTIDPTMAHINSTGSSSSGTSPMVRRSKRLMDKAAAANVEVGGGGGAGIDASPAKSPSPVKKSSSPIKNPSTPNRRRRPVSIKKMALRFTTARLAHARRLDSRETLPNDLIRRFDENNLFLRENKQPLLMWPLDDDIEAGYLGWLTSQNDGGKMVDNIPVDSDSLEIPDTPLQKPVLSSHSPVAFSNISARLNENVAAAPISISIVFLCGPSYEPLTDNSGTAALKPGTFTSSFVDQLEDGKLELASPWIITLSPDPLALPATLSSQLAVDDTWVKALSTSYIVFGALAIKVTLDRENGHLIANPTELTAEVQLDNITLSFSTAQLSNVDLNVNVDPNAKETSIESTVTAAMVTQFYSIVSLGLQVAPGTAPLTWPVTTVLETFSMPWLSTPTDGNIHLPGFEQLESTTFVTLDTSASGGNALSFRADSINTQWLNLRFKIAEEKLMPFLRTSLSSSENLPFDISSAYLIARCQSDHDGYTKNSLGFEMLMTLGDSVKLDAFISFERRNTILTFNVAGPQVSLDTLLSQLASLVNLKDHNALKPSTILTSPGAEITDLGFLQAQIIIDHIENSNGTGTDFSIQCLSTVFEVQVFATSFKATVTCFPTPGSDTFSTNFTASLWTEIPPPPSEIALVPFVEPYTVLIPTHEVEGVVLFSKLTNNAIETPTGTLGIDLQLDNLSISATMSASGPSVIFQGSISSLQQTCSVPTIGLGDLDLYLSYDNEKFDVKLTTTCYLVPRSFPNVGAAPLEVSVEYDSVTQDTDKTKSTTWTVTGSASDLQFDALYGCFSDDAKESVMDILQSFDVPFIQLEWTHSHMSKPDNRDPTWTSVLEASGSLVIGPFELDIQYRHDGTQWNFAAILGTNASESYPLVDLLTHLNLTSDELKVLSEVPFISRIQIPSATPMDGSDPPVCLAIFNQAHESTAMSLQITIVSSDGTLSCTFAQLNEVSPTTTGTTIGDDGKAIIAPPTKFKRLLRVMLDKLPQLPSIPVVGQIEEPFDSIEYVWVGDTAAPSTQTPGFTESELDTINKTLSDENAIRFRPSKSNFQSDPPQPKGGSTKSDDPIVLAQGHHFIVTSQQTVILDHLFGSRASSTPPVSTTMTHTPESDSGSETGPIPPASTSTTHTQVTGTGSESETISSQPLSAPQAHALSVDSGKTMGSMQKSFGPFTVTSVGLQCKDGYLYILLDATIALGPIRLTLVGFGLGIPLDLAESPSNLLQANTLKSVAFAFDVILSGMSVYFSSPPVLIAGVFIKDKTSLYEAYKGGLAVSIMPYTLLAVGEYKHTFSDDFKSVFVFARLDGPLFTLEFAEISDVEAGFGYNYMLRSPNASEIPVFPLVKGITASADPIETLNHFGNFNTVAKDSLWFAVGFKVDAFEILTIDAAAFLQFGPSSVKVALVAIGSASMPPNVPDRREAFVYVELGIVASLDILAGTLTVQGQLTPNSFVLYPDCHLVGGFALCYWFHGSPYEGEWVFTIGGYHPAFQAPSYYPVVTRVGINWNLSDVLSITGESFFAITPKAVMGGGRLQAVFNSGPIYAHFEAWASFLMNFKPFFFIADIGVSVEVGFQCDIGIIHIDIHAEIDADVHLQGPKFGGHADVDLKIHKFTIYFGDQDGSSPPLTWPQFLNVVQQQRANTQDASALSSSSSALAVIAIVDGSADNKDETGNRSSGDPWRVRSGTFKFRVESKVPFTSFHYNTVDTYTEPVTTGSFHARLMQRRDPLTSNFTVNITPQIVDTNDAAQDSPWQVTPIIRNLPMAIWGQYDPAEDPTSSGNSIASLLSPSSNPTTTALTTGYTFLAPPPRLPNFSLPEFNATEAMSEGVFQDGSDPATRPPRAHPLLPRPGQGAANVDERPILEPTPPEQSEFRPVDRPSDYWNDLLDTWRKVDDTTTQAIADLWASTCSWGKVPQGERKTSGFGEWKVKKPDNLLGSKTSGTAAFEAYYAGCPQVAAVAA